MTKYKKAVAASNVTVKAFCVEASTNTECANNSIDVQQQQQLLLVN